MYSNSDQLLYLSPLQKARRALREALKKAAQDLFVQNSPKQLININFECEDPQDFCENEENIEFDWLIAKNFDKNADQIPPPAKKPESSKVNPKSNIADDNPSFGNSSQEENYIPFKEDSNQQNTDFPTQFLSMPDLDPEPNEKTGEELLAEFNIDAHGEMVRDDKDNEHNSLNCVLPSINSDPNDDVTMTEKENENLDQYNGEWDQMFSDIMINKGNNHECGSDLKELYSQISRTIDLLND